MMVESKGSQGNDHDSNTVFTTNQMWDHLEKQVLQLMKYKANKPSHAIFFMANPDVERLVDLVASIQDSLDTIGIVQLWVAKDFSVRVVIPESVGDICNELGIR